MSLISVLILIGTVVPSVARASVLSAFLASIKGNFAEADTVPSVGNLQTMALLKPAKNLDPAPGRGGGDISIVDDSALVPEEGPAGAMADIEKPKNSMIAVYVVREGDTLSRIAEMYGVSPNTIIWANDLSRGAALKVGQQLTILPITGVRYTVKKGDTLAIVAKKYGGDATEIANYNGIDSGALAVGTEIIIPDGEVAAPAPTKTTKSVVAKVGTASQIGYYMSPLGNYIRTQGIHGYNGVDLAPVGNRTAPIMASAAGQVIIAKSSGYNGGYGNYIVIQHDNGSQTLYSHLSSVSTYVGAQVVQGQVIGNVGNTGRSTGPHLHFEIRNGVRNPF